MIVKRMLHLGIVAITAASGAAGYFMGKRQTTGKIIPKKEITISKPNNFRKIVNKEKDFEKEFESDLSLNSQIRSFPLNSLKTVNVIDNKYDEIVHMECKNSREKVINQLKEAKKTKRDDILCEIKNFDKSNLNSTEIQVYVNERDNLLNEIKYENKRLKRVDSLIKNEKKEKVTTFIHQIEMKPTLNKINPLLIAIRNEIERRNIQKNKVPSLFDDIVNQNYKLKPIRNIEVDNILHELTEYMEEEIQDLLNEIDPIVEIISLTNKSSLSSDYDDHIILRRENVSCELEICSDSGIHISEYLADTVSYESRHNHPKWKNTLRHKSY